MNIRNIIAGSISAAGKCFLFLMVFAGIISMTSCSESDETEDEFENWQEHNDKYFNDIYNQAETAIKSGDESWKIIRVYSKDSLAAKSKTDFIVVHVETEGTGTDSPIYTDKVAVHSRGNIIPSESYADGFQFYSSWIGDYNLKTMLPKVFTLYVGYTGYARNATIGFTTALMNMHKGDRWKVYIPYALGHGISNFTPTDDDIRSQKILGPSVPAFSTLIYDITLADYAHAGETLPTFQ